MIRRVFFIATIIASFFLQRHASASTTEAATVYLQSITKEVISLADDKSISLEKRRQNLVDFADHHLDSVWMARFVLGKYWRVISDAEKAKFIQTYRQFLISVYAPKFKGYNGESLKIVKATKGQSSSSAEYYVIDCLLNANDGKPAINVSFRLKYDANKFMVIDVIGEGVSLLNTERSEFSSVIDASGINGLIADLETKINKKK